jgi:hypothetical protein
MCWELILEKIVSSSRWERRMDITHRWLDLEDCSIEVSSSSARIFTSVYYLYYWVIPDLKRGNLSP